MIVSASFLENRMCDLLESEVRQYKEDLADCVGLYSNNMISRSIEVALDAKNKRVRSMVGIYSMATNLGSDTYELEELHKRYIEADEELNKLYGRFIEWVRNGGKKGG